jgi:hypothetical protein
MPSAARPPRLPPANRMVRPTPSVGADVLVRPPSRPYASSATSPPAVQSSMPVSYPTRHSHRLRNYDYSQAGAYFVTLCTESRRCIFGDVVDGVMTLSDLGKMVQEVWENLPRYRPSIELDVFVVMPNHLHGIVVIQSGGEPGGRTRLTDQARRGQSPKSCAGSRR